MTSSQGRNLPHITGNDVVATVLVALVLFSPLWPGLPRVLEQHSETSPKASGFNGPTEAAVEITEAASQTPQVQPGSIVRISVKLVNRDVVLRIFYVGASFESWDRTGSGNIWQDLPGWGFTTELQPGEETNFSFGNYTILNDEYVGYHGIFVRAWLDSERAQEAGERWFERVLFLTNGPSYPWFDDDHDGVPNYLDNSALIVKSAGGSLPVFGRDWGLVVREVEPSSSVTGMLGALRDRFGSSLGSTSYSHAWLLIAELSLPFTSALEFASWLAQRGLIDPAKVNQLAGGLRSLLGTDDVFRIAILARWNSQVDWKVDSYVIRDRSPVAWLLTGLVGLVGCFTKPGPLLALDALTFTISAAAILSNYYKQYTSGKPVGYTIGDAVDMIVYILLLQLAYCATTSLLATAIFGIILYQTLLQTDVYQSITGLLNTIRDPLVDVELHRGEKTLLGASVPESSNGLFWGASASFRAFAFHSDEPVELKLVSKDTDKISFSSMFASPGTNWTSTHKSTILPGESISSTIYLRNGRPNVKALSVSSESIPKSVVQGQTISLRFSVTDEQGLPEDGVTVLASISNNAAQSAKSIGSGVYETSFPTLSLSGGFELEIEAKKPGFLSVAAFFTITIAPFFYSIWFTGGVGAITLLLTFLAYRRHTRKRRG